VYGGGGIRPDVVVADDTLSTEDRDLLRAVAPQRQAINTVLANYALELKGSVGRDFTAPATWGTELMSRMNAAGVKLEPKYQTAERTFFARDLATRVTRLTFGDAAAKARNLAEDRQLTKAITLIEHNATQAQLLAAATSGASGK